MEDYNPAHYGIYPNQHPEDYAQQKYSQSLTDAEGYYNQQTPACTISSGALTGGLGSYKTSQAQTKAQAAYGQLQHSSLQSETADAILVANRIRSAVNRLSDALLGPTPEPNECDLQKCVEGTDSIQSNVRATSRVLSEAAQTLDALLAKISNNR